MQTFEMVKTVALATFLFLSFSFLWAVVLVAMQPGRTKATGISYLAYSILYNPVFWISAILVTALAVRLYIRR